MKFRPWVKFPDGVEMLMHNVVATEADRQAVLTQVSALTMQRLGIEDPAQVRPDQARLLASKVVFYRMAIG